MLNPGDKIYLSWRGGPICGPLNPVPVIAVTPYGVWVSVVSDPEPPLQFYPFSESRIILIEQAKAGGAPSTRPGIETPKGES